MLSVRFTTGTDEASLVGIERGEHNPFSSGAVGHNVSGKVIIDGTRYQVSCNLIAIEEATPEAREAKKKARLEALRK